MSTVHSERNFNDWVMFSLFFLLDKHEHMSIFLLPSPLVCISGIKRTKNSTQGLIIQTRVCNKGKKPQNNYGNSIQHVGVLVTCSCFSNCRISVTNWFEMSLLKYLSIKSTLLLFQTLVNLLSKLTEKNSLACKPFSSLSTPEVCKEGCHLSSN